MKSCYISSFSLSASAIFFDHMACGYARAIDLVAWRAKYLLYSIRRQCFVCVWTNLCNVSLAPSMLHNQPSIEPVRLQLVVVLPFQWPWRIIYYFAVRDVNYYARHVARCALYVGVFLYDQTENEYHAPWVSREKRGDEIMRCNFRQ